jgi:Skp family chaperone for outer membrane proteins
MKLKVLFLLTVVFMFSFSIQAQRGVRIGYIDTEYILENVPEYQEATAQLETKVQKWKSEIETRLGDIEQKRKDLSNEKALLTKELIEEREEDITFEELEILDYQQKRFGPNGDLMLQKKQLMQPIQDQIFASVQDIAANKKYDFIFDKSADVVMLYSANRFDISEQVLRSISRASKRKQVQSRTERKDAEDEELVPEINEEQEAREKALQEKQDERAKATEQRRQEILEAREAKKKEAADRRAKVLEDRAKAKQEKLDGRNNMVEDAMKGPSVDLNDDTNENNEEEEKTNIVVDDAENNKNELDASEDPVKTKEQLIEENRQQKLKDREARKQALEDRKKKILEARAKAKAEREQKENTDQENNN